MTIDAQAGNYLDAAASSLAVSIAESYYRLTGSPLIPAAEVADGPDLVESMYRAPQLLLCHDGADDPKFTYANQAALAAFELPWSGFIGMPSRLSAAPDDQSERSEMITQATASGYFTGYSGVRVASSGRTFRIVDATLWRVTDSDGTVLGLACKIPHIEG